jgi:hypothetical protein
MKDRFEDIQTTKALIPSYLSESELVYNNRVMPNGNLPPFKPTGEQPTVQMQSTIASNQNDAITTVNAPNRDGYDVSGCRYDYKDSQQNLTRYGPPVSLNSAYDCKKAANCGSLFYPLHG